MKTTDTHVYFWNGIYSNWHPATFVDIWSGVTFKNSEQAFMWYKAYEFNDEVALKRIEFESNPRDVKKIGRTIQNYNDELWNKSRLRIMMYVNYLKFTQNAEFLSELIATEDKILVEASPLDCIWGVGLAEDNPLILDEKNWKGQNLLGVSLMEVRKVLKNIYGKVAT